MEFTYLLSDSRFVSPGVPTSTRECGGEEQSRIAPHIQKPDSLNVGINKIFKVVATCTGLAVAVVSATAGTPAAADAYYQTYPGANCVEENAGISAREPVIRYLMNRAENNATSMSIFVCPIDAPPVVAIGSTGVVPTKATWSAQVYDGSGSSNFLCRLHTQGPSPSISYTGPAGRNTGTGYATISPTSSTTSTVADVNWSMAVFLRCDVPGRVGGVRSRIESYTLLAWE